MYKIFFLFIFAFLSLVHGKTEQLSEEHQKRIDELRKQYKQLKSSSNNTMDVNKALEISKEQVNIKTPKMRMPTKTRTEVRLEDRPKGVNKTRVENKTKKLSKLSSNMSAVYKFLSNYGTLPREEGNLPGEKEAYTILKDGKVKITNIKEVRR